MEETLFDGACQDDLDGMLRSLWEISDSWAEQAGAVNLVQSAKAQYTEQTPIDPERVLMYKQWLEDPKGALENTTTFGRMNRGDAILFNRPHAGPRIPDGKTEMFLFLAVYTGPDQGPIGYPILELVDAQWHVLTLLIHGHSKEEQEAEPLSSKIENVSKSWVKAFSETMSGRGQPAELPCLAQFFDAKIPAIERSFHNLGDEFTTQGLFSEGGAARIFKSGIAGKLVKTARSADERDITRVMTEMYVLYIFFIIYSYLHVHLLMYLSMYLSVCLSMQPCRSRKYEWLSSHEQGPKFLRRNTPYEVMLWRSRFCGCCFFVPLLPHVGGIRTGCDGLCSGLCFQASGWVKVDGSELPAILLTQSGQSIEELMTAGKVEPRFAVAIAVKVLRILKQLRAMGRVHGDLHAGNILASRPDVAGSNDFVVVLCDFETLRQPTDVAVMFGGSHNIARWKSIGYATPPKNELFAVASVLLQMISGITREGLQSVRPSQGEEGVSDGEWTTFLTSQNLDLGQEVAQKPISHLVNWPFSNDTGDPAQFLAAMEAVEACFFPIDGPPKKKLRVEY
jgi:hypothetical protein